MRRMLLSSFVILGVLLGIAFSLSPGSTAQEGGSLIISVFQCPDDYSGDTFAADCVEPAGDVEFFIGTPNTGNVDSTISGGDGLATFALEPFDLDPTGPDAVSVGEQATQTGDFAVSCTKNDGETLDFVTEDLPFAPMGPLLGITFDFETGDDIACEWYRLSLPMPGEVEAPGGDDEIAELPNTGSGLNSGSSNTIAREAIGLAGMLFLAAGVVVTRCRLRTDRVPRST